MVVLEQTDRNKTIYNCFQVVVHLELNRLITRVFLEYFLLITVVFYLFYFVVSFFRLIGYTFCEFSSLNVPPLDFLIPDIKKDKENAYG
jgi:hypothetical protein